MEAGRRGGEGGEGGEEEVGRMLEGEEWWWIVEAERLEGAVREV